MPSIGRPARMAFPFVAALWLLAAGCRETAPRSGEERKSVATEPIERVLQRHTPELMTLPGVTGTYQGESADGKPVIRVMVVKRTPELERRIPKQLEGYPVEIEETGIIRPFSNPDSSSR